MISRAWKNLINYLDE